LLLPGFPLSHPDHEWLARALLESRMGSRRLGLYVEQPYARRAEGDPRVPSWGEEALGTPPVFEAVSAGVRDRFAKWRAIRRYRSQLPLLGMNRSLRCGPHSILRGETIGWVPSDRPLSQG
jgi:LmbE family N-acetylglucosaminyl deacetylase